MDRRSALRLIALGASTPVLGSLAPGELLALGQETHARAARAGLRSLSPARHRIVAAAAERIIPRTDTAGALDAEVDRFIDVILTDWFAPDERDRFLAGVDAIDRASRDSHETPFVECSVDQQAELLETIDRAHFDDETHWFGMLKHLTLWGYFTSELGVTEELAKYTRSGTWQGCAPLPKVTR